jgi:hypothetical protein
MFELWPTLPMGETVSLPVPTDSRLNGSQAILDTAVRRKIPWNLCYIRTVFDTHIFNFMNKLLFFHIKILTQTK